MSSCRSCLEDSIQSPNHVSYRHGGARVAAERPPHRSTLHALGLLRDLEHLHSPILRCACACETPSQTTQRHQRPSSSTPSLSRYPTNVPPPSSVAKEPPRGSPIATSVRPDPFNTAIHHLSIYEAERDGCRRINVETKASESGHHHLSPTHGLQMTMVGSMDNGYVAHAHHRSSLSCESAKTSAQDLTGRVVEEQHAQLLDIQHSEL